MRVFVYRNLHRQCWSVRALEGPNRGRVVLRSDSLTLTQCSFLVSEAGRQRVLRERRKNVHAGVVGQLHLPRNIEDSAVPIRYNPYESSHFRALGAPLIGADMVQFAEDGGVWGDGQLTLIAEEG